MRFCNCHVPVLGIDVPVQKTVCKVIDAINTFVSNFVFHADILELGIVKASFLMLKT